MPRNLALDSIQGTVSYGVWINVGATPPQIVRTRFETSPGGGVSEVRPIAAAAFRSKPSLSIPPNGSDGERHWIAWLDGRFLRFVHFDPTLGASPPGQLELGQVEAELISPLCGEPTKDARVRAPASALLWVNKSGGDLEHLQVVRITAGQAIPGAQLPLAGPQPDWMTTFARSDGSRLMGILQQGSLRILSWTDRSFDEASPRIDIPGNVLAAGATLDAQDGVRGAILHLGMNDSKELLLLTSWQMERKGRIQLGSSCEIAWKAKEPVSQPRVRVSDQGVAVALLRDAKGTTFLSQGGGLTPLPDPVIKSPYPLEIAFLGGIEPILICGMESAGFQIMRVNGKPLPPRP